MVSVSFTSHPLCVSCIFGLSSPDSIVDLQGAETTLLYSLVDDGWNGLGEGNIEGDPHFVSPISSNYRLAPGSPCIDAGVNAYVPMQVIVDLDGNPRFVNDPESPDSGLGDPPLVDMGSYEFQSTTCPEDLDGDTRIGVSDLLILMASWGPCTCPADLDGNGMVDTEDMLQLIGAWGSCPG